MLSYGSIGTTTASDSLPAPDPLPDSHRLYDRLFRTNSQDASAGEGLPSSRRHLLNVPRPLTPGSPSRLHFQDLHRFHGLHREPPGSALPQCLTTRQASLALRTAQLLPQQGFRRWAPTRPVSRPSRQPATGPPDSYPDRTFTGRRRRASDQVMTAKRSPPDHWAHRLQYYRGFAPARRGMPLVSSAWGLRSVGDRDRRTGPVYEPHVAVSWPAGRPSDRSPS